MNSSPSPNAPLALVTGAAGIIGPAIVNRLQSDGWRVIATDRTAESFALYAKAFGGPLTATDILPADLSSQAGCEELVRRIEARHGDLTALVNGAAYNPHLALEAITETDAVRLMAVNFLAPIFLVQAAAAGLKRTCGSVVNLSTVLVDEPRRDGLLYASSKAALETASQILAMTLKDSLVRVNIIRIGRVPGYAYLRERITNLTDADARDMVAEMLAERAAAMEKRLGPLSVGYPRDIANGVAWLVSAEARFVNAQTLVLDGGYRLEAPPPTPGVAPVDQRIAHWLEKRAAQSETPCKSPH